MRETEGVELSEQEKGGADTLSSRLKIAREALGGTQKGVSELLGISFRSWQDYEKGKKIPGSQVLSRLCSIGLSADWLLTGVGNMFISNRHGDGAKEGLQDIDRHLLSEIMIAVEEIVDSRVLSARWDSKTKAQVVSVLYRNYSAANEKPRHNDPALRAMIDVLLGD